MGHFVGISVHISEVMTILTRLLKRHEYVTRVINNNLSCFVNLYE